MKDGASVYTKIFNAAIFIILEIAALSVLSHSDDFHRFAITRVSHTFMAEVWGRTENLSKYFSLKSENKKLYEENFALLEELSRYRKLDEQIITSHQAGDFSKSFTGNFKYIPVSIMKVSSNSQHNYIILGEGSEEGIRKGSGIITRNGVVGIVDAVGKHYSYAISFRNHQISVSSRIGKEGSVGRMSWSGKSSKSSVLREIPIQEEIVPGDTVYTSGFSSIFPSDIPLGTIKGYKMINGATYDIYVDLFQDLSSARYATVAINLGKDEIAELEENESGHNYSLKK